jgi:hypothetical protein
MRAVKAREARAGLFVRLFRVIWVVSLTGTALICGVYWIGKSHCPAPCRIDGPQAAMQTQPDPQTPSRKTRTVR